jgi:signal transduction histidine kinase/CheY-like chemotaxis protein
VNGHAAVAGAPGGNARAASGRASLLFLAACGVGVGAYFLVPAPSQLVYYQLFAVAGLAAVVVGIALHRSAQKLPWVLVAGYLGCQVAADSLNNVYSVGRGEDPPYPSAADALCLGGYGFLIAGGILLGSSQGRRSLASLIDAMVIAVSFGLPIWVLLIDPLASDKSAPLLECLTTIAYPVLDVIAIGVVAHLAFARATRSRSVQLLLASIVLLLATDLVYGLQELKNLYADGGWIDAGWMIAYVLPGAAALDPSMRSEVTLPPDEGESPLSLRRLIVLSSAVMVVPFVLAARDSLHHLPVVVSASLIVGLVLSRLGLERHRFRTFAASIAERRQLEEQLRHSQKMEALGHLAGGISHDFNNLLTVITGYAELVARSLPAGSRSLDDVAEIQRAGERATALTRRLLAFSGRQMVAPAEVDVCDMLTQLEGVLRTTLGERIRLVTAFRASDARVLIDPSRLEQVILNLVINARDAMQGHGTLTIELADAKPPAPGGPQPLVLRVTDTGQGIDPGIRERIFEPFVTTKARGAGTGLGLSTVYSIIAEAGGTISVESTAGEGARFDVTLPRSLTGLKSPTATVVEPPVVGRQGRILVAEDEDAVRGYMAAVLRRHGYEIIATEDGRAAVSAAFAMAPPPDLFVSDIVMPHLDGPGAASLLRERWPGLPVLFVSGYVEDPSSQTDVARLGAIVLEKPLRPAQLISTIDHVMGEARRATMVESTLRGVDVSRSGIDPSGTASQSASSPASQLEEVER